MIPPVDKWSKVYGVLFALMCGAMLGIVVAVVFSWDKLCAPVVDAFAELGRDFKLIMKGEG